jgi:hypothetical protein
VDAALETRPSASPGPECLPPAVNRLAAQHYVARIERRTQQRYAEAYLTWIGLGRASRPPLPRAFRLDPGVAEILTATIDHLLSLPVPSPRKRRRRRR